MTLSTQGGRQESHTSLIKAVFSTSSFSSGCHVDGEEELSSCVVEVHGEGDLERGEGRGVTVSKMCSLMTLREAGRWGGREEGRRGGGEVGRWGGGEVGRWGDEDWEMGNGRKEGHNCDERTKKPQREIET